MKVAKVGGSALGAPSSNDVGRGIWQGILAKTSLLRPDMTAGALINLDCPCFPSFFASKYF